MLMEEKTILVTGATDGIGKQTALELARQGARLLLHGRDARRGAAVVEEISRATGNSKLEFYLADLSSQKQIRDLADEIRRRHARLDVLLNNAGVYRKERTLSEDGLEMTFAVNHLAPFLLTNLLLDLLLKSAPARIITVSSVAYQSARLDFENLQGEKKYHPWGAYAISKLGNILFTFKLAEMLEGANVTANALHPGTVSTKLLLEAFGSTGASVEKGAETSVFLASSPEVEGVSGRYFVDQQSQETSPLANDKEVQQRFWEVSEQLCGQKLEHCILFDK